MNSRDLNGILLLDKPLGISSNGILQRVKKLLKAKKAGHTGSLDPLATGMLPICFGEATKFSQFLLDADKTYHVVAKLGEQTTTGDKEGELVSRHEVSDAHLQRLSSVLTEFIGEQEQVPPMFSALKLAGKPLYELARKGMSVERKARHITIFSLTLQEIKHDSFTFYVHCSKGTYVRTLVEGIGNALGCGAHVTALRRESVAPYDKKNMHDFAKIESLDNEEKIRSCLLPVEAAVSGFPEVILADLQILQLYQGKQIEFYFPKETTWVRLKSEQGQFIGMGECVQENSLRVKRLLKNNFACNVAE